MTQFSAGIPTKKGLMTPTLRLCHPLFSVENIGGTPHKIIDKGARMSPLNAKPTQNSKTNRTVVYARTMETFGKQ